MDLVQAIRTAPTDDAAAEMLAEHERQLVAMANASEAAAVALARQSRAAETAQDDTERRAERAEKEADKLRSQVAALQAVAP